MRRTRYFSTNHSSKNGLDTQSREERGLAHEMRVRAQFCVEQTLISQHIHDCHLSRVISHWFIQVP